MGNYGWLNTRYSFSFADWYEPLRMGFGALRVLNDDHIAAGAGFGEHPHRDMEIITIVTKGAVRHSDSMGNTYVVGEGDIQVMSAASGVVHAEYNDSNEEVLELLQLWIVPHSRGGAPSYREKHVAFSSTQNDMVCLVGEGGLSIKQDAFIYYGNFDRDKTYTYPLSSPRHGVYLFVLDGTVMVGDDTLNSRDALGVVGASDITITTKEKSSFLIIEVPMI
jgi:redox-sensitive bicupin YhaK (pirin superfamily)